MQLQSRESDEKIFGMLALLAAGMLFAAKIPSIIPYTSGIHTVLRVFSLLITAGLYFVWVRVSVRIRIPGIQIPLLIVSTIWFLWDFIQQIMWMM